ncbi:hypothetical protein PHYC_02405 [Phycisphaerales bacterium]|nr:hypothetical protein PHYC_02405 [Phycisphaerales bacterium]
MTRMMTVALALVSGTVALAQNSVPAEVVQPAPSNAPAQEPVKAVYDEKADVKADVSAALARAAKDNKRVLIQWGGNWCGWCIMLDKICTTDPEIKKTLGYEYEVVHVDIGRFDKNTDLVAQYGADIKSGVPYLTVLGADGKVVKNQETGSLEVEKGAVKDGIGHDRAKVLVFLQESAAMPRAEDVLARAKSEAAREGKVVFLHFGAPWCGWCHRLENWMARPEIAAVLGKEFVDCKIDEDRMVGGKDLEKKFNPKGGGIPWIAFVDGEGKVLATSDEPGKGNIGFPAQPNEIAHFEAMLKQVKKHLTDSDVAGLVESLKAANKK